VVNYILFEKASTFCNDVPAKNMTSRAVGLAKWDDVEGVILDCKDGHKYLYDVSTDTYMKFDARLKLFQMNSMPKVFDYDVQRRAIVLAKQRLNHGSDEIFQELSNTERCNLGGVKVFRFHSGGFIFRRNKEGEESFVIPAARIITSFHLYEVNLETFEINGVTTNIYSVASQRIGPSNFERVSFARSIIDEINGTDWLQELKRKVTSSDFSNESVDTMREAFKSKGIEEEKVETQRGKDDPIL